MRFCSGFLAGLAFLAVSAITHHIRFSLWIKQFSSSLIPRLCSHIYSRLSWLLSSPRNRDLGLGTGDLGCISHLWHCLGGWIYESNLLFFCFPFLPTFVWLPRLRQKACLWGCQEQVPSQHQGARAMPVPMCYKCTVVGLMEIWSWLFLPS